MNRYKNLTVQAKASIWYATCSFIQKGISVIVIPIYIRLLTTSEYGNWSVFQAWRDILIIFASLNLYCGVYTKTLVDIKDDRDKYTSSMLGLGTTITGCFFLIYCFSYKWCNQIIGMKTPYILMLFLYFVVYPAFSFWTTRQKVENKYHLMVFVTVVMSVLTPSLSVFLLLFTNLRENALVLGFFVIQIFFGLYFYIFQFWKGKVFFHKDYWEYATRFNIPLIPHYLSLIILGQSDRIMIKQICGESDAGIYSFSYQIASLMNTLLAAINGARVPWTYEQLRDKSYAKLKTVSNGLSILFGIITIIVMLLAPDILRFIGTVNYASAVYVIPIVALGVYYTYLYDMFCSIEFYYGATKKVMIASVIGGITNIILNAWLIPIFGFISAAYTTLFSYLVLVFMHYLFMNMVRKKNEIDNEIYDIRFTAIFSIVLTFIILGGLLTYRNYPLRYLIIIAVLIVIVIYRNRFMELIKTLKVKD